MKNIKLNQFFYKTWSFWLALLAILAFIADWLTGFNSPSNQWVILLIIIGLLIRTMLTNK